MCTGRDALKHFILPVNMGFILDESKIICLDMVTHSWADVVCTL